MSSANAQWLEAKLVSAMQEDWCMNLGCTTCGNCDVVGLLTCLPVPKAGFPPGTISRMSWDRANEVVEGLRNCDAPGIDPAIMLILFMLWLRFGERAHSDLFPKLEGTHSGEVLAGMRSHYAIKQERQRQHQLRQGVKTKKKRLPADKSL